MKTFSKEFKQSQGTKSIEQLWKELSQLANNIVEDEARTKVYALHERENQVLKAKGILSEIADTHLDMRVIESFEETSESGDFDDSDVFTSEGVEESMDSFQEAMSHVHR